MIMFPGCISALNTNDFRIAEQHNITISSISTLIHPWQRKDTHFMLIWKITPTAATEICDKEDKCEDSV
jgi:hypothetical protein